jgi:exodeoxyribonuclease V alpha subunit
VLGRLTVIVGGPGTGKTAVVVRVLAALGALARAAGREPPRVALIAPTGKAAARLSESIRQTRGAWIPEAMREGIPDDAATIHRCLGMSIRTGRPRFHGSNPLRADIVVVDEASMVDLPMMARVIEALPPTARLILLGDPHQLVSVEMGAVLGDIRRAASGPKSGPRAQALAAVGVELAAEEVSADPKPVLADSLVTLEYTWRYAADSGIGRLASAINAGDATAALEVLDGGAIDAVRIDVPEGAGWRSLFALLRKRVVAGYRAVVTERDPAAALSALRRFRVLCAHRKGLRGVETLNRRIEEWLEAEGLLRADEVNYAGRPILVGRNDNRCGLFNGDVGILLPDSARPGIIRAWFDGPDGTVRSFRPAMLPEHATVFATTVHKSQGSEYEEVLLVLPEQPSPLLTRELLYTAVTRATTRVTVLGSRARVIEAVERPVWRMSGWG